MKTLIVVAHPEIHSSSVNKRWVDELDKHSDLFTVHNIYQCYPEGKIDVAKEQALVERHGALVLQFPLFWFNCPALLKQWLDEVFTYGWAFGSSGDKLKGRKVALAVSAGIRVHDYSKEGRYGFTLEEVLRPFEMAMRYVRADYQPFFAIYGDEGEQGAAYGWSQSELDNSAGEYIKYLINLTS